MTKFTKERLIERARMRLEHMQEAMRDHSGSPDACMELRLAEMAYAAVTAGMAQEPVAYMVGGYSLLHAQNPKVNEYLGKATPLYATPRLPQPVEPKITSEELDDELLGELIDFRRGTLDYHVREGNKNQSIMHGVVLRAMLELQERRAAEHQDYYRDLSQPVDPQVAEYEKIMQQAIPDGWVAVPVEPTHKMINAWLSEIANWRGHVAGYKAMLAAAPQQEVMAYQQLKQQSHDLA